MSVCSRRAIAIIDLQEHPERVNLKTGDRWSKVLTKTMTSRMKFEESLIADEDGAGNGVSTWAGGVRTQLKSCGGLGLEKTLSRP